MHPGISPCCTPKFLSTPSARRATCPCVDHACSFLYFYPRPPRGGRLTDRQIHKVISKISIHALREEGDRIALGKSGSHQDFYPRPPRGGRLLAVADPPQAFQISIHALREEGDLETGANALAKGISIHALREEGDPRPMTCRSGGARYISIHALREEGDGSCLRCCRRFSGFLSTPSARRATAFPPQKLTCDANFYPRPPRGGRQDGAGRRPVRCPISIHALREEGDQVLVCGAAGGFQDFYPRPPRGGRHWNIRSRRTGWQFLSTPSARRATQYHRQPGRGSSISIHALREEGDGENDAGPWVQTQISIHALREEGDS